MHINITWQEYTDLITQLANQVDSDMKEHNFDQILCLARGGMLLGDAFNRIFHLPLAVLFASSYKITQEQDELIIDNQIAKQNNILGKRILLVDDLVDSGKTLEGVAKFLKEHHDVEYIKTAVIWKKTSSTFSPDYYAIMSQPEDWIVQPFEQFEHFKRK